ncbi:hypothetical protein [Paenibacillus sp. L3-i20]|uniref:hypothetical protein n=1 Tax=Paenibacillus sp. L3-i20 TaxID=2905833 RepID=UPI001EE12A46|nr:hypothetical protein [Paenibacillus sp. L3-i20]GKU80012.1 hypothetical protein L3i20_v244090 [Paenibacillus sp. L3-i20]
MSSSADFGCSGGCGSIPINGSPAILTTLVQNGSSIQLQGFSNITLAAGLSYLIEYNAQFSMPVIGQVASAQLTLNGSIIPGSQTLSFPATIPPGLNTPVSTVSGGVVFNTPATPNPSIVQLIGFPPAGIPGINFSTVNIRIVELENASGSAVTNNNAAMYGFGYQDVGSNQPVAFIEANVVNGSGIQLDPATRTFVTLAPNSTYYASYSIIACPEALGVTVRVLLALNDIPMYQSLAGTTAIPDLNSEFTGASGSAVFNTGPGTNTLELINTNVNTIKFVSVALNIMQIG